MTLQQAIDILEYRHKWFNIKTINATLGDVHALFSFQEKWQSEYGTNPFDDRVMMDAIAVIIDHHRSPSRPQESDTEPTPEPFTPKVGDILTCTARNLVLVYNNEYEVARVSENDGLFWVKATEDEWYSFGISVAHTYFKPTPQKEANPKGVFYEAKQAALDYIQKAKDGPTPEKYKPKKGDFLKCKYGFETAQEIYGAAPFIIGKDYPVVEKAQYDTHDFAVKNELGNPHGFDYATWDEFFDLVVADKAEPFTPKEGDVLIAIDPCVLQGGFRHGMNALTVNAEYKVISCNGNSFVITDDIGNGHTFTFDYAHKYFKRKE